VPTQPSLATIQSGSKYWLEQVPYTAVVSTLAANSNSTIFPRLTGWNSTNRKTFVELTKFASTAAQGLQFSVAGDMTTRLYYGDAFPPDLDMVDVRSGAFTSLSFIATNTSASTMVNTQVNYLMTTWNEPIAFKVLRGIGLTADEAAIARRIGLDTSPVAQKGNSPFTIDAVIRSTYENRQIKPSLGFSNSYSVTTSSSTIEQFQVENQNQMLILRRIAGLANFDDQVSLLVDRDNDGSYVNIRVDALDLERGIECFVPALDHLTFHLQAVTTPNAKVPIRAEIWVCSLSNILRDRLGLIDVAGLQQVFASTVGSARAGQAAADFDARVKAGVN
jgi:hypothetical protein